MVDEIIEEGPEKALTAEDLFREELEYQGSKLETSKKKLTKAQRKFNMTLQKVAKARRKEIESISRLDPLLKAFFTKPYKGD